MQIKRIFNEIFNNIEMFSGPTSKHGPNNQSGASPADDPMQLLYAYIEAELDGTDAAVQFPEVHSAVLTSVEAHQQYVDLKEILEREREGTLVVPSNIPAFDFSYLSTTSSTVLKSAWQWDEMGRLIIEFSRMLLDTLQSPMEPALSLKGPVVTYLKSPGEEKSQLTYQINQQSEADLVVSIVVQASVADTSNVAMTVDIPSLQGAPLMADSRINLSYPGQDSITQTTDPFGQTTFRNVPSVFLPELRFVVEPVNT